MVDVDVCLLSHLKEELAWAIDKQFPVITTIMLFKATKELKKTSCFKFKEYCIHCYVALSNIF